MYESLRPVTAVLMELDNNIHSHHTSVKFCSTTCSHAFVFPFRCVQNYSMKSSHPFVPIIRLTQSQRNDQFNQAFDE